MPGTPQIHDSMSLYLQVEQSACNNHDCAASVLLIDVCFMTVESANQKPEQEATRTKDD